jgi:hypothetical protein
MSDKFFKNLMVCGSLSLILFVLAFACLFLTSCQYIPEVMSDFEKIADNDAIIIKCDKDAFQKQTDVEISVKVINKDKP